MARLKARLGMDVALARPRAASDDVDDEVARRRNVVWKDKFEK